MKKYKHIIFDLDGTIYDSENSIFEIWKYLLNREFPSFDVSKVDLHTVLGISTNDTMKKFNLEYSEQFNDMFAQEYKHFAHLIKIYDGMDTAIKCLHEHGYKLGIVSSRAFKEYDLYMKPLGIDTYFESKVFKDDTTYHKPNPDPIYLYLKINNINKEFCIYIGDMDTDVRCAKNAGISSALMVWDKNKIINEQSDFIFYSAEELLNFFI